MSPNHYCVFKKFRASKTLFCLLLSMTFFFSCRSEDENIVIYEPDEESLTISNIYPAIGEEITVTISGYEDAEGSVDFGDGSEAVSLPSASHTYESEGTYVITAEYTAAGKTLVASKAVKVAQLALTRAIENLQKDGNNEIWVMAHRANTENYAIPENSISAVKAAIAAGADAIECDPRLTQDGQIVVCHDESIARTTTGTGNISDLTLSQIKSYSLLDRNGNATDEQMPTLKEFLEAARGKVYVDLDYSPRTCTTAQVLQVVEECGMLEQCFFYTSGGAQNTELLDLAPTAHAYCFGTASGYSTLLNLGRAFFVQYLFDSDVSTIAASISAGMIPSACLMDSTTGGQVESNLLNGDDTVVKNMISIGMRMLMTDYPATMVGYLRSQGYHD